MTISLPTLEVVGCAVGYGNSCIVRDVNFTVSPGEILLIVGRNASGKSTLVKGVFGQLPMQKGEARFRGVRAPAMSPHWWHRQGVAFVHQGARVFCDLPVRANLRLARIVPRARGPRASTSVGSEIQLTQQPFKWREDQLAGTLSGGERQLLALLMAMQGGPDLVCLDEPSIGLSASARATLYSLISEAATRRVSFIIVEQKWREVVYLASRSLILHNGSAVWSGLPTELEAVSAQRGFAL